MHWLSFFIGLLVGWLIELAIDFFYWRRRAIPDTGDTTKLQNELNAAKDRIRELETEIEKLRAQQRQCQDDAEKLQACNQNLQTTYEELETIHARVKELEDQLGKTQIDLQRCTEQLEEAQAAPPPAVAFAPVRSPEPMEPDDLRKIEGIGVKIAGILNKHGILTFAQLAGTEVSKLEAILEEAGARYRLADPSTWPQQANLAATGDWEGLKELQDQLSGGRAK
ncbi:MAG: hypothetical protein JW981_05560 [Anaerolineae bacterium]|nr:hypothetical protein [Anaerolineae bacterium]